MKTKTLGTMVLMCAATVFAAHQAHAITSVSETACNSRLDVTVASTTRSSAVSSSECQDRDLSSAAGFALSTTNPAGGVVPDSAAMVSAGGELYEAFVASAREAAVLLTPNRALMMSRAITGDKSGVDWNMGLAVQPVSGATNAWLTGTYTLLRANQDVRIVDAANQTDAELSEVFDPVTLRITFDGNSGCSISSYSSWFSYSLTTDPAGAFSQPDGDDYGLHQAVYAGEGYAGSGGSHEDSVRTFTDCDYVLSSDGKLLVTYDYNDGDVVSHSAENSYFVSADLRYLVSTVDASADLYRGFEVGVRVKTISGTQDERNDGVAGTFLFNAPALELQGATGVLSEPDNQHRNDEKAARCMSRGSLVLSTTTSATADWNTCTWDVTNTCSVRGEEGEAPSIALSHYTVEGAASAASCRFQLASDGSVSFVVNLDTAEGAQDLTFSGAIADNNEAIVLKGKYVGTDMADPSDSNPPERDIKSDLVLSALVGVKYGGSLVADADSDGLSNLGEFLYADFVLCGLVSDYDCDGDDDILLRNPATGQNKIVLLEGGAKTGESTLTTNATTFEVAAVLDGDGDGDADILWYDSVLGKLIFWQIQNGVKGANFFLGNTTATLSGTGDFDGDGDTDILMKTTAGAVKIWTIQNLSLVLSTTIGTPGGTYQVIDTGDFNNDGIDDIVMQNAGGTVRIWQLNSSAQLQTTIDVATISTAYQLKKSGDTDNDGDDDLVFRNDTTGQSIVWVMQNGARLQANVISSLNAAMSLATVTDFDKDGDEDMLFRDITPGNSSDGDTIIWKMQDSLKQSNSFLGNNAVTYALKGTLDVDGDGDFDILYRDSGTGGMQAWNMQDGVRMSNYNSLGAASTSWEPRF